MKVRFYCENCGKEVPFNAEICPYCGKVFDAVKCPICGYEGSPSEFSGGCPKCGYLAVNMNPESRKGKLGDILSETVSSGNISKRDSKEERKMKISPLLFRIVVISLLVILFFLIYLLFRV